MLLIKDVRSRGRRLLHFVFFNKKGEAVEVGGGCVSVGGRQTVRVWGNFECAARARLCLLAPLIATWSILD